MYNKTLLRKQYLAIRQEQNKSLQLSKSTRICDKILKLKTFAKAQNIAFYLAHNGEVMLDDLINKALLSNINSYLPIIKDHTMLFAKFDAKTNFKKNKYNILEPPDTNEVIYDIFKLDLIIVPLVAFDINKNRLGMGGGYYDKILANIQHTPVKLAVAYQFQKAKIIPCNNLDVKMDIIVTEDMIY